MPKGKIQSWWIVIEDEAKNQETLDLDLSLEITERIDRLINVFYDTEWEE